MKLLCVLTRKFAWSVSRDAVNSGPMRSGQINKQDDRKQSHAVHGDVAIQQFALRWCNQSEFAQDNGTDRHMLQTDWIYNYIAICIFMRGTFSARHHGTCLKLGGHDQA